MAKKGKMKISKVKRNNHTTNKMRKQGTLRLQRHRAKVQKQKQPQQSQEVEYSSESDSASGEEWADMLDADEQQYIMQRLATQPSLLSNVPEKEQVQRSKKRKREDKGKVPKCQQQNSDSGAETNDDSDSELEDKYEKELSENPAKRMRPLLPIKTKHGLLERAEEVEDTESEQEESYQEEEPSKEEEQPQESESDSGMEGTVEDNEAGDGETISAVQLLAARRDKLQHDKLRIGALCSSLLESPEKKLKNFFPILYLMEERLKDNTLNLHSVRKLATLSAYEVFKDILPDYMIRHQDYSNIKLKKDTLALYKYEKELVEFYKRYLQRLEKAAMVLRRKKGDTKKPDEPTISLALVSLRCMCGMLEARPQFNYAANIAQSVVPYLDCREDQAREIVTECCRTVFGEDQKGEITLAIVRLINQLVKRRGERLHPAALDCLLSLRIRDVDMDAAADLQHKKKQDSKHKKRIVNLSKKEKKLISLRIRDVDMDAAADLQHKKKQDSKHKKRIVNLSKKEKKRAKKLKEVERELLETEAQESELARRKQLTERAKKLKEVERELLETEAQESELARRKQLTEVTKTVFHVYFRLLKTAPRSRLLAAALKGLTKFTHVINMEYYSDLVAILSRLVEDELIGPRERLLCVRTVLGVLAGAGDALTVDPAKFHQHLYASAIGVHAGASQSDARIVLEAVWQICSRARRVSPAVLQAFAKRLATFAAQTQHHAALAALALLQQLAQQSKAVSNLLEPDSEAGSGRFEPLLPSPEHCNAHAAALHELCAMRTHYHPVVRQQAAALMQAGNVAELNKLSPLQIFDAYDGSQMAFKPAIPPPKKSDKPKSKSVNHGHTWVQNDFKTLCENVENSVDLVIKNSNR